MGKCQCVGLGVRPGESRFYPLPSQPNRTASLHGFAGADPPEEEPHPRVAVADRAGSIFHAFDDVVAATEEELEADGAGRLDGDAHLGEATRAGDRAERPSGESTLAQDRGPCADREAGAGSDVPGEDGGGAEARGVRADAVASHRFEPHREAVADAELVPPEGIELVRGPGLRRRQRRRDDHHRPDAELGSVRGERGFFALGRRGLGGLLLLVVTEVIEFFPVLRELDGEVAVVVLGGRRDRGGHGNRRDRIGLHDGQDRVGHRGHGSRGHHVLALVVLNNGRRGRTRRLLLRLLDVPCQGRAREGRGLRRGVGRIGGGDGGVIGESGREEKGEHGYSEGERWRRGFCASEVWRQPDAGGSTQNTKLLKNRKLLHTGPFHSESFIQGQIIIPKNTKKVKCLLRLEK